MGSLAVGLSDTFRINYFHFPLSFLFQKDGIPSIIHAFAAVRPRRSRLQSQQGIATMVSNRTTTSAPMTTFGQQCHVGRDTLDQGSISLGHFIKVFRSVPNIRKMNQPFFILATVIPLFPSSRNR
jgi:hypothetical protein